jgi:hypothetical protein
MDLSARRARVIEFGRLGETVGRFAAHWRALICCNEDDDGDISAAVVEARVRTD